MPRGGFKGRGDRGQRGAGGAVVELTRTACSRTELEDKARWWWWPPVEPLGPGRLATPLIFVLCVFFYYYYFPENNGGKNKLVGASN